MERKHKIDLQDLDMLKAVMGTVNDEFELVREHVRLLQSLQPVKPTREQQLAKQVEIQLEENAILRQRLLTAEQECRHERWHRDHDRQLLSEHLLQARATATASKSECQTLSQQLAEAERTIERLRRKIQAAETRAGIVDEDALAAKVGDRQCCGEPVQAVARRVVGEATDDSDKTEEEDLTQHGDVKEPVTKRTRRSLQQPEFAADESEEKEVDRKGEEEELEESSEDEKVDDEQQMMPQTRSGRTIPFSERLEALKIFKKSHGHLLIPQRFKELGNLGFYVQVTRSRYHGHKRRSPLPPDEIDALNEIGFEWNGMARYFSFDERLEELKKYKAEHNHLLVPDSYKDQHNLGAYVHRLRSLYKGASRHGPQLTKEKIAKLEAIGFVWEVRKRKIDEQQG